MKKKLLTVIMETEPAVIASAASLATFWWLMKYSILDLPDMIGAMVVIYFVVLWRMLIWMERRKKRSRK